jgi:hypothetical protein
VCWGELFVNLSAVSSKLLRLECVVIGGLCGKILLCALKSLKVCAEVLLRVSACRLAAWCCV